MYISIHVTYPILMKLELSRLIFEKYSKIKFDDNRPVEAELLHADRRTDITKLTVAVLRTRLKKEGGGQHLRT
jgi:hypothetical protein